MSFTSADSPPCSTLSPLIPGDCLPLSRKQDVLAAPVAVVPRPSTGSSAPLAAGQASPARPAAAAVPALRAARHHWYVLHPWLQRQPELPAHPIAITVVELLWRGAVQNTDLRWDCLGRVDWVRIWILGRNRLTVKAGSLAGSKYVWWW